MRSQKRLDNLAEQNYIYIYIYELLLKNDKTDSDYVFAKMYAYGPDLEGNTFK